MLATGRHNVLVSSDSLFALWKLHQIDEALAQVRARVAALDSGRKLAAELEALERKLEDASRAEHALGGELTDLELKQKGLDEKIKKLDKALYGGSVVNPREVENMQREIESLKKQRGDLDLRILELWELIPPAKEAAHAARRQVEEAKHDLEKHMQRVREAQAKLEAAFKDLGEKRRAAAAAVEASLLARYEAIRSKHNGVGMSRVQKDGTCEQCGTFLPRKTVELAKEHKWVTCESCHRILYWSEGIV